MANYALGSSGPGCLFWLACIFEIGQRASLSVVRDYDILFVTYVCAFAVISWSGQLGVSTAPSFECSCHHQRPRYRVGHVGALRHRSIRTPHVNVFSSVEIRQRVGCNSRIEKRARRIIAQLVSPRASHTAAGRPVVLPPPRRRALASRSTGRKLNESRIKSTSCAPTNAAAIPPPTWRRPTRRASHVLRASQHAMPCAARHPIMSRLV